MQCKPLNSRKKAQKSIFDGKKNKVPMWFLQIPLGIATMFTLAVSFCKVCQAGRKSSLATSEVLDAWRIAQVVNHEGVV